MRALVVLMMTALAGCGTTAPTPAAPSATVESAAPDSTPANAVELTRGMWVETRGFRIMLRGTRTEHQSASARVDFAELDLRKGHEELTVTLERQQPGDVLFVEVFDTEIALESVDTSEKPSKAQILVRR